MLQSSRWVIIWWWNICCKHLQAIEVSNMGRLLVGLLRLPFHFVNSGVTRAWLQSDGIALWCSEACKTGVMAGATVFLTFFFPYAFFLTYSLLVYFLTYVSTSRIDPFHFQAEGLRRRTNLALVFCVNFNL